MEIGGLAFKELFSSTDINEQVLRIAEAINADFEGKNPIFISILNGSFMFASDLMKSVNIPAEISFVKFRSYQNLSTTGTVNELLGLEVDIKDRDVLIIEDIVDTGKTLSYVLEILQEKKPKSIKICTLLYKPASFDYDYGLAYVGFEIENKFVVGYGLDYNEQGRNTPNILVKV